LAPACKLGRGPWLHERLANVVHHGLDFGCAQLSGPPHHGRARAAVCHRCDHALAGELLDRVGRREIARRRDQAVTRAAHAVASITVTDRTIIVVEHVRTASPAMLTRCRLARASDDSDDKARGPCTPHTTVCGLHAGDATCALRHPNKTAEAAHLIAGTCVPRGRKDCD